MEIVQTESNVATVRMTRQEIAILANALNETREALEDWEYSTRVGASPAEAEAMRQNLNTMLAAMK